MNRRSLLIIALIGLAAQFSVMGLMIARREMTLRNGVVCRFLTAPVDPYDAFRGRYVALNFAENKRWLCDCGMYADNAFMRSSARDQRLQRDCASDDTPRTGGDLHSNARLVLPGGVSSASRRHQRCRTGRALSGHTVCANGPIPCLLCMAL